MLMLDPASGAIGGIGSGRWIAVAIFSLLVGASGLVAARSWQARSVVEYDCEPIELELRDEPPDTDDDESAAVDADSSEGTCSCDCAASDDAVDDANDDDSEGAPLVDADNGI